MGLDNIYKMLFDIRILHHFFLDEGSDVYQESGGGVPLQSRFDHNRLTHNLPDFLRIVPTRRTQQVMKNHKVVFQQYDDGIRASMKRKPSIEPHQPFIEFGSDFMLDFTIEIVDPYFVNYTDIEWSHGDDLIYLSNADPTPYTPASEKHPPAVPVNFTRLSLYDTATPGASFNINLLDKVEEDELLNKFGFIRIYLFGDAGTMGNPDEISLAEPGDSTIFNTTTPELDLYLPNRETKWRYFADNGATTVYTSGYQPLTKNGYIKTPPGNGNQTKYPNPDGKLVTYDSVNDIYYSDVFISNS